MSSSTKFGFRPRALDVTRKLPIRIRKCRKTSPKVKRTVATAPTGMEKEEEMESHLQQAILAQKATSAGDSVKNHVIPTPKVTSLTDDEYDRLYPPHPGFLRSKKLLVFNDFVPFFLTQNSYNADSDDEEWLSSRRNINIDDFEHIIEKLEISSQNDIIRPRNARAILSRYDFGLVDDVYDYWLQKRQKAASAKKNPCPRLLPKISSELSNRRDDNKSIANPYIAFRRRLDKVQTRKKQRTELSTYEKLLQINFIMKRSIVLTGALAQREKLKKELFDTEYDLFKRKIFELQQARKKGEKTVEERREDIPSTSEIINEKAEQKLLFTQSSSRRSSTAADSVKDDKCLQRNLELWNSASQITSTTLSLPSTSDDSSELEKIAATENNSCIDGRYQFKRKHGCSYNAPIPRHLLNDRQQLNTLCDELSTFRCFTASKGLFLFTQDVYNPQNNSEIPTQRVGFVGKRMGRGGRQIIDLFYLPSNYSPPSPPPTNNSRKTENNNNGSLPRRL
ncbi:Enhancer of polycomb-like protein [Meloidogyne graminicola]|uniref:Enhancer of polycomb-like protein n=1 Tax=Meloidogyne graminicola TaxID=189291 RepID=A0A8S9ZLS6_9BILA|nr:Enhancer of polycomb-like protein [Meloidogyne graminicola]